MKAALSMGVYLFLRVGEIVSPKTTWPHPAKGLNVDDVEFFPSFENADRMEVHIKNSKGDPFRNGCRLKVHANLPGEVDEEVVDDRGRTDKANAAGVGAVCADVGRIRW